MWQFVACEHSWGGFVSYGITLYAVVTAFFRWSLKFFKAAISWMAVRKPVFYGVWARGVEPMAYLSTAGVQKEHHTTTTFTKEMFSFSTRHCHRWAWQKCCNTVAWKTFTIRTLCLVLLLMELMINSSRYNLRITGEQFPIIWMSVVNLGFLKSPRFYPCVS